ncbi:MULTISPECIES: hypothetical protein [unclassified Leptolyngbya]|uniref:hypothetical protein n=1 Tax=unclassified Leptolyngbya TaxID=2650499 RepID=UPI001682AEED|nr:MULTISPECIES: hypothetical protein [unclassified Leptolyngbya]MBD1912367.1 hypothetical protein [Leptolyngbya sp. FACHB-8]MBD2157997.1 hypothetical protein [Leptolyngbya sp. FACHB-16]
MSEPFSMGAALPPVPTQEVSIQKARLTTAIFCVMLAITLSICYTVVQPDILRGFEQVQNSAAVSVCLLLLPQGYRELRSWLKQSSQTDVGMDAIVTLLGLAVLIGLSWLRTYLSVNFMPFFWVLAVLLLCLSLWRFMPTRLEWRHWAVGGIVFAFYTYIAWVVWGFRYMSLRPNASLLAATLHIDNLFHSSVAAMIQTYGVPSTGIDGPVYLPYHIASHWLFAQLAPLLDLSVFRFYNLAYPILIVPILFHSFLNFVVDLRSLDKLSSCKQDLRKDWKFWGLLFLGFVGFLPIVLYSKLRIFLSSSIVSQSQLFALSLAFLCLSLCLKFLTYQHKNKNSISTGLLILCVSLLLWAITLSKVSVGFVLFNIVFYSVLRLRLYTHWLVWVGLIASIGLQLQALSFMGYLGGSPMPSNPAQPFAYLAAIEPGLRVFWFPILFLWSVIYLSLRLQAIGLSTVGDLVIACRTGKIVEVEIIVVACFLGLLPGMLLDLAGGAAYYFMDFQIWLSLSFLLGNLHCSDGLQIVLNPRCRSYIS